MLNAKAKRNEQLYWNKSPSSGPGGFLDYEFLGKEDVYSQQWGSLISSPIPFPYSYRIYLSECAYDPVIQLLKPLQWVLIALRTESQPLRLLWLVPSTLICPAEACHTHPSLRATPLHPSEGLWISTGVSKHGPGAKSHLTPVFVWPTS